MWVTLPTGHPTGHSGAPPNPFVSTFPSPNPIRVPIGRLFEPLWVTPRTCHPMEHSRAPPNPPASPHRAPLGHPTHVSPHGASPCSPNPRVPPHGPSPSGPLGHPLAPHSLHPQTHACHPSGHLSGLLCVTPSPCPQPHACPHRAPPHTPKPTLVTPGPPPRGVTPHPPAPLVSPHTAPPSPSLSHLPKPPRATPVSPKSPQPLRVPPCPSGSPPGAAPPRWEGDTEPKVTVGWEPAWQGQDKPGLRACPRGGGWGGTHGDTAAPVPTRAIPSSRRPLPPWGPGEIFGWISD